MAQLINLIFSIEDVSLMTSNFSETKLKLLAQKSIELSSYLNCDKCSHHLQVSLFIFGNTEQLKDVPPEEPVKAELKSAPNPVKFENDDDDERDFEDAAPSPTPPVKRRKVVAKSENGEKEVKKKPKKKYDYSHKKYDSSIVCHLCPKVLPGKYKFDAHLRREHNIGKIHCAHCHRSFNLLVNCRDHLVKEHFPHLATLNCDQCGLPFTTNYNLRTHIQQSHSSERMPCSICEKTFVHKSALRSHLRNAHVKGEEKTRFYCGTCGKVFFTKHAIELHESSHLPEDKWEHQCQVCKRRFPNKTKAVVCAKRHDTSAFSCSVCGRNLSDKQCLKDHMNIHTVSCFEGFLKVTDFGVF